MLLTIADSPSKYRIVCGEHELDETESSQIMLDVTEIIRHPYYVSAPQGYDIAVYKVNSGIALVYYSSIFRIVSVHRWASSFVLEGGHKKFD